MKIERVWAMPNRDTFSIKPIRAFVQRYLDESTASIDPYARNTAFASITNDLNPATSADYHMDAVDFMKLMVQEKVTADLVILDPPYSPRQVKECYDSIGLKMKQGDAWGGEIKGRLHTFVDQLLEPGGVVLRFGWNTNGMGKKFGYDLEEILLVSHGSDHNDTICIAERKPR